MTAIYDADGDGFICSYCCDDFTPYQLHETYGCNTTALEPLRVTTRVLERMREADCLVCGLPASRGID